MKRGTVVRAALIAGLLLFLFYAEVPERSLFWSAFFDTGHTPLFGVIAVLFRGLFAARARKAGAMPLSEPAARRVSLLAFATAVFLGAATEVLQMLQRHGDPSAVDLLRDAAGAAAFLIIADIVRRSHAAAGAGERRPLRLTILSSVLAAMLLLVAGATLLRVSAAYLARNHAFPVLFRLDGSWWEQPFVNLEENQLTPPGALDAARPPERNAGLARLDLRPGPYSGIAFDEPYPDWRAYRQLVLTIVSDLGTPLPVVIRVHDAHHAYRYRDRFNRALLVRPGVNRIAIPLDDIRHGPAVGREMDMSRIKGMGLFVPNLKRRTHIYLGALALE